MMMRPDVPMERSRSSSVRRARGSVLAAVLILAAAPGWAHAQAPEGVEAKTRATPLARYVPREGLAGYLELDGLDAHPAAWQGSAANRLLNETRLGAVLEDILNQLIGMSRAPIQPGAVIGGFKELARQGFVLGVWSSDSGDLHHVWVIRGAARGDLRRLYDMWPAHQIARQQQADVAIEKAGDDARQKAGRTIEKLDDQSWWFEKDDLVLTDQPDLILALLDGKRPDAVDHPLRAALRKGGDGFEPVAIGFLDFAGMPKMSPPAVAIGLDGVKRLELVLGFEGAATRTELRAVAPTPRRGVLALLDQPAFDADSLPPVPAGVHGFAVLSVDLPRTYDRVTELLYKTNRPGEGGPDAAAVIEDQVRREFGFDLRKDLIAGLGPKLTFSMQDPAGGKKVSHAAALINRAGGVTLTLQIRNEAALSRSIGGVVKMTNFVLTNVRTEVPLQFRQEEGGRPKYVLNLPEGLLPPPFSTMFRPMIILGPEELVVGASTAAADRAAGLSAAKPDGRWQPDEAFAPVMRRLPRNMVALRISDPRETMPAIIEALPVLAQTINAQVDAQRRQFPGMPVGPPLKIEPDGLPRTDELIARLFPASTALVVDDQGARLISREPIPGLASPAVGGLLVALLLPATQASSEAARRAQCINDLKQIALAYHNFHSATNAFPAPAITDKDGKPLLSWRVAILPYIEQQELYNKFKLDEPWDSPHNKALIKEMPAVYLCPSHKNPEPGTTTYRVFVGDGAMFQAGQVTPIQSITDGTSNTILVVEAKEAVPWTKPDDLKFDMNAKPSLYGAGSPHPGGFNAAFADGAVRFLKNSINVQVWKALITRAGGEVIAADAF
jgi:prepilin-type processing-associated H-X9-DG protein